MIANDLVQVQPIVKQMYNTLTDQTTAQEMAGWVQIYNLEIEKAQVTRQSTLEKYCKRKKGELVIVSGVYQIPDKDKPAFELEVKEVLSYQVKLPDLPSKILIAPGQIEELKRLGIL
jgi:hypothetical protein